jgi:transposase
VCFCGHAALLCGGLDHARQERGLPNGHGLAELVRQHLQADPLSGELFVFRNKRADRIKLLYWDEDGFVIVYKRLEAGTFRFPPAGKDGVEIRAADLQMLLDGVDLESVKRSKRYRRPPPA